MDSLGSGGSSVRDGGKVSRDHSQIRKACPQSREHSLVRDHSHSQTRDHSQTTLECYIPRERSPRDHLSDEPQSFEIESEELDPRVQEELEKLNSCTDEINMLEIQLDDANTVFRSLLTDSTHHLKSLSKRLGSCIEKARPYYEALDVSTKAASECQKAAVQFQRAAGIHAAAKETISLAEERFLDNSGEWQFDNAWQEMLNHATIKVMDAEKQRTVSEKEHLARCAFLTKAEQKVKTLEKKLNRHIEKSKPYFEQKDVFNKALGSEKARIQALQKKICNTKSQYAQSLRNLEEISESIHARRRMGLRREPGPDLDSLQYDLDQLQLGSRATSRAESSALSDEDSALGSSSVLGSSEPVACDDVDGVVLDSRGRVIESMGSVLDNMGTLNLDRRRSLIDGRSCVPRTMSLPEVQMPGLLPAQACPGSPATSVINAATMRTAGDAVESLTDESQDRSETTLNFTADEGDVFEDAHKDGACPREDDVQSITQRDAIQL